MDIIAPIIQQPYNVTPVVPTKSPDGVLQHNLLPQQVIQATVVSAESNQIVLDLGKYTLAASTQQPLMSGQKLKLQVVSTEPQLQLQIVDGRGDPSILRMLHLFDHRSELGSQLATLLGQRSGVTAGSAQQPTTNATPSPMAGVTNSAQGGAGQSVAGSPQGQGVTVASPHISQGSASELPAFVPLRPSSANLAAQIKNQAGQPSQVSNGLAHTQGGGKGPATQGAQLTSQPVASIATAVSTTTTAAVSQSSPLSVSEGLGLIQRQTLEGALLPQQWGQLEQLSSQIASSMDTPNSRLVMNLARMLGLDFEALLNKNQLDPTQPGLKGILTELKSHAALPEAVRESANQMSQQLEVFQLCRLRLAQDGILFLPLPLEFIEQGYVLFEQQGQGGDNNEERDGHLVSLNLTLKQLGAMQVNLLFEQEALFVRIKCQDAATVDTVEHYCSELHEALQPFSIRSIQVTTGAEDPALALLHRLQPQTGQQSAVFDARV